MEIKKEKLEELSERMIAEKESLIKIINEFAKENKSIPNDWNARFPNFNTDGILDEEADEVEEYSSLLSIEKVLELKIQNLTNAIEKINRGEYGKCSLCSEPISTARIELIPEAKTCKKCKNNDSKLNVAK